MIYTSFIAVQKIMQNEFFRGLNTFFKNDIRQFLQRSDFNCITFRK